MPTWLAVLVAIAVITAVYFLCIRPMRRGGPAMGPRRPDPELQRQLADLREELRVLRAEDALAAGPPSPGAPRSGTD